MFSIRRAIKFLLQLRFEKEEEGGWKEWQEGYLEEITPLDPSAIGRLAWGEETFPEIPSILGKLNAVLTDNKSSIRGVADASQFCSCYEIFASDEQSFLWIWQQDRDHIESRYGHRSKRSR